MTPDLPVELPTAAAPTKNVLGTRQTIRLADWCREQRELCEREPNAKLAARATAALEFTVTAANISNSLEALEIEKWKPEEEKPLDVQVMALRSTMQEMMTVIALLTARVTRLEGRAEGGEKGEERGESEPKTKTITITRNGRPATQEELEAAVHGKPLPPFRPEYFARAVDEPHFPSDCASSTELGAGY